MARSQITQREYLDTQLVNSDFENVSEDELNTRLKTVYTEDGKLYKRTTLQSIPLWAT